VMGNHHQGEIRIRVSGVANLLASSACIVSMLLSKPVSAVGSGTEVGIVEIVQIPSTHASIVQDATIVGVLMY